MPNSRSRRPRQPVSPEPASPRDVSAHLALLAILALAVWIYWPVHTFPFVTWDDGAYVLDNGHVASGLSGASVLWALTAREPYWHPLTWLSHLVDVTLFGLNAGAHHVVNLALHLANVVCLTWALVRLGISRWSAITVAALFAVHPLHVESVAWVAERKDVLSALFALLAIGAYGAYARTASRRAYVAVGVCLALSLLAKPMYVTLPVLLLGLDWWPLRRPLTRATLVEKLPFAIVCGLVGAAAWIAQTHVGTTTDLARLPLGARLGHAAVAYVWYLGKTIWPANLAAFYPYPAALPTATVLVVACLLLATMTMLAVLTRRAGFTLTAWFWFVWLLVPVIGLVQVGNQAYADRFMYLPLVGLLLAPIAWLETIIAGAPRARLVATAAVAALTIGGAVVARAQVWTWSSSEALWSRVLAGSPADPTAHSALGAELADRGDLAGARWHQEQALAVRPDDPEANNELGIVLARSGDPAAAIQRFERALSANPSFDEARKNLGQARFDRGNLAARQGDLAGALADLLEAARLLPARADTQVGAAVALLSLGRRAEALPYARAAAAIEPANPRLKQLVEELLR